MEQSSFLPKRPATLDSHSKAASAIRTAEGYSFFYSFFFLLRKEQLTSDGGPALRYRHPPHTATRYRTLRAASVPEGRPPPQASTRRRGGGAEGGGSSRSGPVRSPQPFRGHPRTERLPPPPPPPSPLLSDRSRAPSRRPSATAPPRAPPPPLWRHSADPSLAGYSAPLGQWARRGCAWRGWRGRRRRDGSSDRRRRRRLRLRLLKGRRVGRGRWS